MSDLLRRPAEFVAGTWVFIVLAGLMRSTLSGNPADSLASLSGYAFKKILLFSFYSASLGVLLIIPCAYICAYVVMYTLPRARILAVAIFIAVFSLPYNSVLQSLLAWMGGNGIIESLNPDHGLVFPVDWLNGDLRLVLSTLPGYLWRYLPIAFFFISFGMLCVPRNVVLAAQNLSVPGSKIHLQIIGRQIAGIVGLLVAFLCLTLPIDAASVSIIGRGQAETFGSALTLSATSPTLVSGASLIGIFYLVSSIAILMVITSRFPSSAAVPNTSGASSKRPAGARKVAAGYLVLALLIVYGLVVLAGLFLLSLGFSRSGSGFFSSAEASLDGYWIIFHDEPYRSALLASLRLGAVVASVSVLLGLVSAWYGFYPVKFPERKRRSLYDAILILPLLLPGVLTSRGVAEIRAFFPSGNFSDWVIALFLHCGLFVSISYFLFRNSFSAIGRRCLNAAINMNLSRASIFWLYLRASIPAATASWLATFSFSINEFAVNTVVFTIGSDAPLAMRLEQQRSTGLTAIDFSAVMLLSGIALLMLAFSGFSVSNWLQSILRKLNRFR